MEVPVGIKEQGLQVPFALQTGVGCIGSLAFCKTIHRNLGGVVQIPGGGAVGADGVLNFRTHGHLVLRVKIITHINAAAHGVLGIVVHIEDTGNS